MNKLYGTHFLSTLIDAQFQVVIYLIFFNTYGLWGLSFVFLSKYILKNALYKYYDFIFKQIKTYILFLILSVLFAGLVVFENLIYFIFSSSLIIIILTLISIRVKVYTQKNTTQYVGAYSKLSLIASVTYLLGTASIWIMKSNVTYIGIACIMISLLGVYLSIGFDNVYVKSDVISVETQQKIKKRVPLIFYIVLITGVLSVLVDNYELPYIISKGYTENAYSFIVFLSSFFYILMSAILATGKVKIYDKYSVGIMGCSIALVGYLIFMHATEITWIVLSMGIIAMGYTMYTTLLNVFIAEEYKENAEVFFVKYSKMENYVLSVIFVISLFKIDKWGIDKYYTFLGIVISVFVLILVIYIMRVRSKGKEYSNKH